MTFDNYTKGLCTLSFIAQRSGILAQSIPDIALKSSNYLESSSLQSEFALASQFIALDIVEMARSDFDSLARFGWFPFVEIEGELSNSISLILIGMHKSAIDCQRRALELSVVAGYLSSEATDKSVARNWIRSATATPHFSKALSGFAKTGFPASVNHEQEWASKISEYYHHLCDSVHTRGEKHSNRKENSLAGSFNGIPVHRFDEESLLHSAERFIQTTALISFMCAMMNPISLFGMPLDEKFGLNPPASGFLNENQSSRLRQIIPKDRIDALMKCAEQSVLCTSAIDWMNSLPDLSAEELSRQNVEFQAFLDSNNAARNSPSQRDANL